MRARLSAQSECADLGPSISLPRVTSTYELGLEYRSRRAGFGSECVNPRLHIVIQPLLITTSVLLISYNRKIALCPNLILEKNQFVAPIWKIIGIWLFS